MILSHLTHLDELKEYNTGTLTIPFSGTTAHYSPSINGVVESVIYDEENVTGLAGSIIVEISGTGEIIWSAFKVADFVNDQIAYPFVYGRSNVNTTGSPKVKMLRVINGPLHVRSTSTLITNGVVNNIKITYR